jgi:hypothetical protein
MLPLGALATASFREECQHERHRRADQRWRRESGLRS